MPSADCDCVLINAKSQYSRVNRSWILGRLVRDHEKDTMKPGLTLSFYKTRSNDENISPAQGVPSRDWVYYSSIGVILSQFGISMTPVLVSQDWTIFAITLIGTGLAFLCSSLPRWREEKWSGRKSQKASDRTVVCLTRGNGYSDVMVIISEGKDQYRLEDLANARTLPATHSVWAASIISIAQLMLLLIISNLKDHAWFLLAIGALGIVQNTIAAGARRDLGTTGIHLEQCGEPIDDRKVMKALQSAELREPYVGLSLLPIFFPGGLRADEEQWRDTTFARYKMEKKG